MGNSCSNILKVENKKDLNTVLAYFHGDGKDVEVDVDDFDITYETNYVSNAEDLYRGVGQAITGEIVVMYEEIGCSLYGSYILTPEDIRHVYVDPDYVEELDLDDEIESIYDEMDGLLEQALSGEVPDKVVEEIVTLEEVLYQ